ncbi:MAG: HipA domain-containing protein [Pseudomonadales bacterium]|nr:HipA domain-containing protein [Pseudomonadales bacterium]
MSPCRLFEENGRSHFMTQRFDRIDGGEKLHMQSLCALGHHDFNQAGLCGYEQAFEAIRSMCSESMQVDLDEQFRRMIFNVVSRNKDDHKKNIAFLMDKPGTWNMEIVSGL